MNEQHVRDKLTAALIPAATLLAGVKVLDLPSKESPAFLDPNYFPFYYHLGSQIQPEMVTQIGPKLGLIGACFMQSCKSIKQWLAMENGENTTERGPYGSWAPASIIQSNLKLHCAGQAGFMLFHDNILEMEHDSNYSVDLALLTEQYNAEKTHKYLTFLWKYLQPEGLLVVDYIHDNAVKDVFGDFCRVKNREPMIFNTRYGVGIIKR